MRWLLPGAVILAVGLATAIWYLRRPLPPLRVAEYTQITHDGRPKIIAGTDGSRLYFNRYSDPQTTAQVAISGGEIAQVPVALPFPLIKDVSPDGSTLLVTSHEGGKVSLWAVQVPAGSLRRLLTGARVTPRPGPLTGSPWSTAWRTETSMSPGAMEQELANWPLWAAWQAHSVGRQMAVRFGFPGIIGFGKCRPTDRDSTRCCRAGAPRPRSAAAIGLPMGNSSYSCPVALSFTITTISPQASYGFLMSVAGYSGGRPPSRFN